MRYPSGVVALGALLAVTTPAHAQTSVCDRGCLIEKTDGLIASMVAHDPKRVPLARHYRATENGVPAALPMMTIWRTAAGAQNMFRVVDPVSQQVLLISDISEGGAHALLFGRVKLVDGRFSEIELYADRSRSDGGFQFGPEYLGRMPVAWTQQVAASRIPDRAALLSAGRAIFDSSLSSPPPAAGCVMMENGKAVAEDPEVLKMLMGGKTPPGPPPMLAADGTVSIPCGAPPERPTDSAARTDIVDEQQGIVVSIATITGVVEPYLITEPTTSAFVPDSLLAPYIDLLASQRATGRYTQSELAPAAASITVVQMHRIFDGKVQGMHLLEKLGPPGASSPWTSGR